MGNSSTKSEARQSPGRRKPAYARRAGYTNSAGLPAQRAGSPMPIAPLHYATVANSSLRLLSGASALATISTTLLRASGSKSDSTQT